MKPNKQKIFSSQPEKPGSASKIYNSRSTASIKTNTSKVIKTINIQPSEFSLKDITKHFKQKKAPMPFKLIKFGEMKNDLKSTTIIKDVKQSYAFVSALSNTNTSYSTHIKTKETTIPTRRSLSEAWKDEEICNNTTDTFINKPESMDLYYGIIPSKYWCMKCKEDVISDVKMNLPTLSV